VWQGLKVINGKIDTLFFEGPGRERDGEPQGYRLGDEVLELPLARKRIFATCYERTVIDLCMEDVRKLVTLSEEEGPLYLHDTANTGTGDDLSQPLSHAWILTNWLNREYDWLLCEEPKQLILCRRCRRTFRTVPIPSALHELSLDKEDRLTFFIECICNNCASHVLEHLDELLTKDPTGTLTAFQSAFSSFSQEIVSPEDLRIFVELAAARMPAPPNSPGEKNNVAANPHILRNQGAQKDSRVPDESLKVNSSIKPIWSRFAPAFLESLAKSVSMDKVWAFDRIVEGVNGAELVRSGCAGNWMHHKGEILIEIEPEILIASGRQKELRYCLERIGEKNLPERDQYLYTTCLDGDRNNGLREIVRAQQTYGGARPAILLISEYGDIVKGREYLKQSTEVETDVLELCLCAKAWMIFFDDDVQARRCLEMVEHENSFELHWPECARTWIAVFDDSRQVHRLLKKMEEKPFHASTLSAGARIWLELFDNKEKAERCLNKAMFESLSAVDWLCVAGVWRGIFWDTEQSRACISKAEHIASNRFDWRMCANAWENLLGDEQQAEKCKKIMEM